MADEQLPVANQSVGQPTERSFFHRPLIPIFAAVTFASILAASYFAGQVQALRLTDGIAAQDGASVDRMIPTIDATAAVSSEKFSMATGVVSDKAEALFVLDHNSGLLQCSVMYPRLGRFLGIFSVNVHDALGTSKGAEYMMTTGMVDIPQSSRNPFATSVVYVLNTSTGMYACYNIPFDRVKMNSGTMQQGGMGLIATGSADPTFSGNSGR